MSSIPAVGDYTSTPPPRSKHLEMLKRKARLRERGEPNGKTQHLQLHLPRGPQNIPPRDNQRPNPKGKRAPKSPTRWPPHHRRKSQNPRWSEKNRKTADQDQRILRIDQSTGTNHSKPSDVYNAEQSGQPAKQNLTGCPDQLSCELYWPQAPMVT